MAKVLTLVVAVVALAGGTFLFLGRHTNADAAVADAATTTLQAHSVDVAISGSVGVAGTTIAFTGSGAMDFAQNAEQLSLNESVGNQQLTENLVYLNKVAYVSIGNEIGQIFPGKSWVSLDLSSLSSSGAAASLGAGSSVNDPASVLQALKADGNTVVDLGSSTVNGQSVQGYSVHLDATAINNEIAHENLPAWMQQAIQELVSADEVYDVYVNSSGLVVRVTVSVTATALSESINENVTMDFSNYGAAVSVTAPPADEVEPFQSFLQAAGSQSPSVS
jgi:hypothetical protein